MGTVFNYARFVLVSLSLILLPVIGCSAPPRTPEQTARYAETEQELKGTEQSLVALAQQLELLEPGTPEHTEIAQQIVEKAQLGASFEQDLANQDIEAAQSAFGPLFDVLGTIVPGLPLLKESAIVLGATALLPRPRQNYLKALSALNPTNGPVAPGQAAKHILAGLGLLDSTEAGRKAREAEAQAAKIAKAEAKIAKVKGSDEA
jgi:hypothetical protein